MTLVSINECNAGRISIFFDAMILFDAIRTAGPTRDQLTRIDPPLRLISSTTLYEVAFAHKGLAPSTLRGNESWIRDHSITTFPFSGRIAGKVDSFRTKDSALARGRMELGDWLLACFARHADPQKEFAIATRDRDDFEQLPVRLVTEFI